MDWKNIAVLLGTFSLCSFSVYRGAVFKTWNKDTKNGFHTAMAFAMLLTVFEYLLTSVFGK